MLKSFAILALFALFIAHTDVYGQDGAGELYTPAYSNPYQSPVSSAISTGAASMSGITGGGGGGAMAAPGKPPKNGVPLDTEAWMLMIAGAALGVWTVLKSRKNVMLKSPAHQ